MFLVRKVVLSVGNAQSELQTPQFLGFHWNYPESRVYVSRPENTLRSIMSSIKGKGCDSGISSLLSPLQCQYSNVNVYLLSMCANVVGVANGDWDYSITPRFQRFVTSCSSHHCLPHHSDKVFHLYISILLI